MNKYLEKIAFRPSDITHFVGMHPATTGMILGGTVGAAVGSSRKTNFDGTPRSTFRRVTAGISSGLDLGTAGALIGASIGEAKVIKTRARYATNMSAEGDAVSFRHHFVNAPNPSELRKELNIPSHIKTKAEATAIYKRTASKVHPDKGGSSDKMASINAAWEKFKAHPDGFDKLAKLV